MKMMSVQTEASCRVMKMVLDTAEQASDALMKMIDAAMTGIGQNIDELV